jgi:hypothetical protein
MCGSVVLVARVGERFGAVTRARRAFRGITTRTPVLPICNFPALARLRLSADGVRQRSRSRPGTDHLFCSVSPELTK